MNGVMVYQLPSSSWGSLLPLKGASNCFIPQHVLISQILSDQEHRQVWRCNAVSKYYDDLIGYSASNRLESINIDIDLQFKYQ
ncbi:hypothetical protein CRYUN_Cryun15aG0018600 [Craigia yunnanensis]